MFEQKFGQSSETIRLRKNLAMQLRIRVMETLAVKNIDDSCHRQSEQKKCASYRKSRKKPFCCHVIEINDGSFKNNLDYLGKLYKVPSNNPIEIKQIDSKHTGNFNIFLAVLIIPFFVFLIFQLLTFAYNTTRRYFRQNTRRNNNQSIPQGVHRQ